MTMNNITCTVNGESGSGMIRVEEDGGAGSVEREGLFFFGSVEKKGGVNVEA